MGLNVFLRNTMLIMQSHKNMQVIQSSRILISTIP